MLLFIALLITTIISVIAASAFDHTAHDNAAFVCTMVAIVVFLILAVTTITTADTIIGAEADTIKLQKEYDSLYYQATTGMYDNPNEVGKEGLAEQITKWNASLARNKSMKHNIWVSVMYPVDYDKFEEIPLSLLNKGA
jgi:predicted PurR-regulated permease PerM